MNGRKPNKAEKKWIESIVEHGCCVCANEGKFTPPQVHHTNGKDSHLETIPLCYYHHIGYNDDAAYTSRHPFKSRFRDRYGSDEELLAQLREKLEY